MTRSPSRGRRAQVLEVLRDADQALSIVQIALALGVHANTARFHLESLVQSGQAVQVDPGHTTPGRPPLMFRFVQRMDPTGPRHYQLLAEVLVRSLVDSPDPTAKAIDAGSTWAMTMVSPTSSQSGAEQDVDADSSIRRLVGRLDDLGFAPETTDTAIGLRRCPFIELAEQYPDVICPIHLGLMQGLLAAWSSPTTVERLEPFAEPDLCLAHLASIKDPT